MVVRRSRIASVAIAVLVSLSLVGCGRASSSAVTGSVASAAAPAGTVFDDEFDGTTLGAPWVALDRPGDASNQELECYRPANVAVSGGNLNVTTKIESGCSGDRYTSGMVQWRQFAFTYGTLEFRARLAGGTGTWPAVWMLGSDCQQSNITTPDNVGTCHWPEPGSEEIDVTEVFGGSKTTVNQGLISSAGRGNCRPETSDVSTDFHVYQLVWAPGSLSWKIDGARTCTVSTGVPSTPMFVMINTAVGGDGGGTVDDATLPQQSSIDYLRVTTSSSASTVPGPPTAVTAVARDAQATVAWNPPPSDGGSPITGYTATSNPGGQTCTWTGGPTSCVVPGLANGTAYTFSVRARNGLGDGPESSASAAATPLAPPTTWYHPLTPGRLLDTRAGPTNVGPYSTPWGPGDASVRSVPIGGVAGVPSDAAAVVLNVTVVGPSAGSFLQLWPVGSDRPTLSSNLNFEAGQIVANAVTVGLGAGGAVRVYNAVGHVDVVIDVTGYYASGGGGDGFTSLAPGRILDSRAGPTNIGPYSTPWGAGPAAARDVQVAGRAGVPAGADAVVLNVTAVGSAAGSLLQVWPSGTSQPAFGSSVNFSAGATVANQVTVRLGSSGAVRVLNAVGTVDIVIDVSGYYAPASGDAFHPIVPGRVLDSRAGATNVGPYSTGWSPGVGGIRDVQVASLLGVPTGAVGVVMNVTAVRPTAGSFLQVWPAGSSQPAFGSNVNFPTGATVANAVTAMLAGGRVRVFNAVGFVDVIVDVAGYFS